MARQVVGTAHVSKDSVDDVTKAIRLLQPDAVLLELCDDRRAILHMNVNKPPRCTEKHTCEVVGAAAAAPAEGAAAPEPEAADTWVCKGLGLIYSHAHAHLTSMCVYGHTAASTCL